MQNSNSPIYYHEDFYRQIELVPEENYFAANRFIDDLPPIEGSIYGFKNIAVRPEQKIKLLDRRIPFEETCKILNSISLFYSKNVTTGYGQSVWRDTNTVVWGFEQFGLFVKYQNSFVEAIWLSDSPVFSQLKTSQHLAKAIFSISKEYSLILIDWNKEIICRIRSQNDVREYLYQNLSFDYY
jgi:hypothetical protein